jgi:quercetin dioxygenase-like cupin family protein
MVATTGEVVVRSTEELENIPHEPLEPGVVGVVNAVVREHQGTYAGVMRVAAGCKLPQHRHPSMSHHVFVIDGKVEAFGRTLGSGSYWFVPAGEIHHVRGLQPDGCTLGYVDVPE